MENLFVIEPLRPIPEPSVRLLTGHIGAVHTVSFSPQGTLIASGGADKMIRVWERDTLRARDMMGGSETDITALAFVPPYGDLLVSGGQDGTVGVWDMAHGRRVLVYHEHASKVNAIAVSSDGRHFASAGDDGRVVLYPASLEPASHLLRGHLGPVYAVTFSPDSRLLVSGGNQVSGGRISVWETESHATVSRYGDYRGSIASMSFSRDGRLLAVGEADSRIRILNAQSGEGLRILEDHAIAVTVVLFPIHDHTLVSASVDNTVLIWHADSGTVVKRLVGFNRARVNALAASGDGRFMVANTHNEVMRDKRETSFKLGAIGLMDFGGPNLGRSHPLDTPFV